MRQFSAPVTLCLIAAFGFYSATEALPQLKPEAPRIKPVNMAGDSASATTNRCR